MRRFASACFGLLASIASVLPLQAQGNGVLPGLSPTVTDLSTLDAVPVSSASAKANPKAVEIGAKSPVYAFAEGTSPFAAFSLPDDAAGRRLHVITHIVGIWMPKAYVFYPLLTFLDAGHGILATVDPDLAYRQDFWSSSKSGWSAAVAVPDGAAYVVVHCPQDRLGTALYYKPDRSSQARPQVIVTGGIPINTNAGGNWWDTYMVVANQGQLRVTLE